MDTIILEEVDFYLIQAEMYENAFVEISEYDALFEADNIQNDVKLQQNQKSQGGLLDALAAAGRAIANMIDSIITGIQNFFVSLTFTKAEKQAWAEYKAAVAKDPSLRNKRISVLDFKKQQAEYKDFIAKANAAEQAAAQGNPGPMQQLMQTLGNVTKGAATALGVSVALEGAIALATTSCDTAKLIQAQLTKDKALLKQLEDLIGKQKLKGALKMIDSQTTLLKHRFSFTSWKVKRTVGYYSDAKSAVTGVFGQIKKDCEPIIGKIQQGDAIGALLELGKVTMNSTTGNILNRASGNKDVQTIGRTAGGIIGAAGRNAAASKFDQVIGSRVRKIGNTVTHAIVGDEAWQRQQRGLADSMLGQQNADRVRNATGGIFGF